MSTFCNLVPILSLIHFWQCQVCQLPFVYWCVILISCIISFWRPESLVLPDINLWVYAKVLWVEGCMLNLTIGRKETWKCPLQGRLPLQTYVCVRLRLFRIDQWLTGGWWIGLSASRWCALLAFSFSPDEKYKVTFGTGSSDVGTKTYICLRKEF